MSNDKQVNPSLEKENKVVIESKDCTSALDFWNFFEIPIPAELQAAFDEFSANPTFENQNKVKLTVCKAVLLTNHDVFRDVKFQRVIESCESVVYDMEFDNEFESTVKENE